MEIRLVLNEPSRPRAMPYSRLKKEKLFDHDEISTFPRTVIQSKPTLTWHSRACSKVSGPGESTCSGADRHTPRTGRIAHAIGHR